MPNPTVRENILQKLRKNQGILHRQRKFVISRCERMSKASYVNRGNDKRWNLGTSREK